MSPARAAVAAALSMQARAAASALEAEGATTRAPSRGPRMQEVRAR